MKTNGATWKAYLDSWPAGQWFDDSDETFDGNEPADDAPSDTAVVAFTCGVVYQSPTDREGKSLTSHFSAWLKAQTHVRVVVSVPKDRFADFKQAMGAYGVKEV
jgi:hypothetical protein